MEVLIEVEIPIEPEIMEENNDPVQNEPQFQPVKRCLKRRNAMRN